MSHGYSPLASISAARGRISPSTICRIVSRKSLYSCGRSYTSVVVALMSVIVEPSNGVYPSARVGKLRP